MADVHELQALKGSLGDGFDDKQGISNGLDGEEGLEDVADAATLEKRHYNNTIIGGGGSIPPLDDGK